MMNVGVVVGGVYDLLLVVMGVIGVVAVGEVTCADVEVELKGVVSGVGGLHFRVLYFW